RSPSLKYPIFTYSGEEPDDETRRRRVLRSGLSQREESSRGPRILFSLVGHGRSRFAPAAAGHPDGIRPARRTRPGRRAGPSWTPGRSALDGAARSAGRSHAHLRARSRYELIGRRPGAIVRNALLRSLRLGTTAR